jgi:hypothetical protein
MSKQLNNPECRRCGILKSTVDGLAPFGPECSKSDPSLKHDFPNAERTGDKGKLELCQWCNRTFDSHYDKPLPTASVRTPCGLLKAYFLPNKSKEISSKLAECGCLCLDCYEKHHCGNTKCAGLPQEKQSEEWQKEFEEIIKGRKNSKYHHNYVAIHIIKPFISQVEQKAIERTVREIWEIIKDTDGTRSYRSVAIIDGVSRYMKSKSIKINE